MSPSASSALVALAPVAQMVKEPTALRQLWPGPLHLPETTTTGATIETPVELVTMHSLHDGPVGKRLSPMTPGSKSTGLKNRRCGFESHLAH